MSSRHDQNQRRTQGARVFTDKSRHAFHVRLGWLDEALNKRQWNSAARQLRHLRALAKMAEEGEKRLLIAIINQRQESLDRASKPKDNSQLVSTKKARKPNIKCEKCGLFFHLAKKEKGRPICSVCRGGSSISVRTVSGGLPTLGSR